jgi:hypothetical protein
MWFSRIFPTVRPIVAAQVRLQLVQRLRRRCRWRRQRAVVGGLIGGVALLVVVIVLVCCVIQRRKRDDAGSLGIVSVVTPRQPSAYGSVSAVPSAPSAVYGGSPVGTIMYGETTLYSSANDDAKVDPNSYQKESVSTRELDVMNQQVDPRAF